MNITVYTIEYYDEVIALMQRTPGVSIRDADSKEATTRYFDRNPGFSFLSIREGKVIACAMCGHDGRRGYLQHVIVDPAHRGKGIATVLVDSCLTELSKIGIHKTHIDVFIENDLGNAYWTHNAWQKRDDIYRYSMNRSGSQNA